jgi:metal-dependent amidase/aminoacylase/carboxypeptidase family protein
MNVDKLKARAIKEADAILPRLKEMKDEIGNNPELGSEEYKASKLLFGRAQEARVPGGVPVLQHGHSLQGSL